jgi:hypothetical protein
VSSRNEPEIAGEWDVVIALPMEAKTLTKGELLGTDGKPKRVSGIFILRQGCPIEIRTYAHKGWTMRIRYLKITRLE